MRRCFDHRYFESAVPEVLRHLHSDITSAYDNRTLNTFPVNMSFDAICIRDISQCEDQAAFDSLDRRFQRLRSG
ncbi:hypothetical protein D3C81_2082480 [compost metagenome]